MMSLIHVLGLLAHSLITLRKAVSTVISKIFFVIICLSERGMLILLDGSSTGIIALGLASNQDIKPSSSSPIGKIPIEYPYNTCLHDNSLYLCGGFFKKIKN